MTKMGLRPALYARDATSNPVQSGASRTVGIFIGVMAGKAVRFRS